MTTIEIPYAPPERMFQDTILAFNDMRMASTWRALIEPDPFGPVNKIVTLMRGNHRVKSVLWPVRDPGAVKVVRDDGAWSMTELFELQHRFWDSRGTNTPPPVIHHRVPGWRIEVDGHTVLTVTDAEMSPPYTPPPPPPLWRRMLTALREQARADLDAVAGRLGYRRCDDCREWDE